MYTEGQGGGMIGDLDGFVRHPDVINNAPLDG